MIATKFLKWGPLVAVLTVGASVAVGLFVPDWLTLRSVKQAASKDLLDPDSAQFRNLEIRSDGRVCGEMNGKNGYGAYVGYTAFMAMQVGERWSVFRDYDGVPFASEQCATNGRQ